MSFFGDAQESPALIFSELHVEMLAFYLQFSRLDDVIHFPLKPPTLPHPFWGMEEKSAQFVQILWTRPRLDPYGCQARAGAFDLRRTDNTTPLSCGAGCSQLPNLCQAKRALAAIASIFDGHAAILSARKKSVEPEDLSGRSRRALRRSRPQGPPRLSR